MYQDKQKRREYLEDMVKLLELMDEDSSGTITLEEWVNGMATPEVASQIHLLGVQEGDAYTLFELLDVDGDANITIAELIEGLNRIKGYASAVDSQRLILYMDNLNTKLDRLLTKQPSPEHKKPRATTRCSKTNSLLSMTPNVHPLDSS